MKIPWRRAAFLFTLFLPLATASPAGAAWRPLGPEGARVRTVAVAPSDAATVYAGGDSGLFVSRDAGATWQRSFRGLPGGSPSPEQTIVFGLAVDPARPETVYASLGQGVWRSLDAGASWQPTPGGPRSCRLVAHPTASGVVYAVGSGGVFRTTNGGARWVSANRGLPRRLLVYDLAIDPRTPRTLYAAVSGFGVWKSADGGSSWRPAGGRYLGARNVSAITLDPDHPSTLWAAVAGDVWQSTNGGERWRRIGSTTTANAFVSTLVFVPYRGTLLAGGTYLGSSRSDDGGLTWDSFPLGNSEEAQAVAYAPSDPRTVYAGTRSPEGDEGGVYQSLDGGEAWRRRDRGVTTRTVASLAVDPQRPERLWVGDASALLFRSLDRGESWSAVTSHTPTFIRALALDPRDSRNLVTTGNGLETSHDDGATWHPFGFGRFDASDLAYDPGSSRRVYAAGPGILASADGGDTWTQLAAPELDLVFFSVVAAPSATVYAAGHDLPQPDGPRPEVQVLRSRDAGATWTRIDAGLPETLDLAGDPRSADTLYAGTQHGVWKTTDGGGHWTEVSAGLPAEAVAVALAVAPSAPDTLYASLYRHGVWGSRDGGASWSRLGAPVGGLAAVNVLSLAVDPREPERVYAGTYAFGLLGWTPDAGDEP